MVKYARGTTVAALIASVSVIAAYYWRPNDAHRAAHLEEDSANSHLGPLVGVEHNEKGGAVGPTALPSMGSVTAVHEMAQNIFEQLQSGVSPERCLVVQGRLIQLVSQLDETDPLWPWAMGRTSECAFVLPSGEDRKKLVDSLLRKAPNNSKVLAIAGRNHFLLGELPAAIETFEKSIKISETAEVWDLLANAKLGLVKVMLEGSAREDADLQSFMVATEHAISRALALQGDTPDPWTLERMAEIHLAQGHHQGAMQWASQAIAAQQNQASEFGAISAAFLYLEVGKVYCRAGQRQTGTAYMDQALNIAPTAEVRSAIQQSREGFVQSNG